MTDTGQFIREVSSNQPGDSINVSIATGQGVQTLTPVLFGRTPPVQMPVPAQTPVPTPVQPSVATPPAQPTPAPASVKAPTPSPTADRAPSILDRPTKPTPAPSSKKTKDQPAAEEAVQEIDELAFEDEPIISTKP